MPLPRCALQGEALLYRQSQGRLVLDARRQRRLEKRTRQPRRRCCGRCGQHGRHGPGPCRLADWRRCERSSALEELAHELGRALAHLGVPLLESRIAVAHRVPLGRIVVAPSARLVQHVAHDVDHARMRHGLCQPTAGNDRAELVHEAQHVGVRVGALPELHRGSIRDPPLDDALGDYVGAASPRRLRGAARHGLAHGKGGRLERPIGRRHAASGLHEGDRYIARVDMKVHMNTPGLWCFSKRSVPAVRKSRVPISSLARAYRPEPLHVPLHVRV